MMCWFSADREEEILQAEAGQRHAAIRRLANASRIMRADFRRPVTSVSPGSEIIVVAAPVSKTSGIPLSRNSARRAER